MFPAPNSDEALQWLNQQGEGDWKTLLAVSSGAPFKALALSSDEIPEIRASYLKEFFQLLDGKYDPVKLAESWLKRDTDLIFQWLANIAIDLIRLSANIECRDLHNLDVSDKLTKVAKTRPPQYWHRFMQDVVNLRKSVTRQLNLQLQLETVLLDLTENRQDRAQGVY